MATTWTGKPAPQRGFSLLELMLVMAVVGLIVSIAALSLSSGGRNYQVDAAAREFADIASYAMDQAEISGTDMGVLFGLDSAGDVTVYSYDGELYFGLVSGRRALPHLHDLKLCIDEIYEEFKAQLLHTSAGAQG